jgi:hypothetical protein
MRLAMAEATVIAKISLGSASTSCERCIVSSAEALKRYRDTSSNQKRVPTLQVKTRLVMKFIFHMLMKKLRVATA